MRANRKQSEGGDRLGLSLQGERLDRLGSDGFANQALRALADQRLPRRRRLLEPGGDVDRIAGGERLSVGGSPATTSPVLTPIRTRSEVPISASSSSLSRSAASRISAAVRTARSASSSRAVGIPNAAMTASPTYFSTVPPWRATAALISAK